jgi:hypothetical protein
MGRLQATNTAITVVLENSGQIRGSASAIMDLGIRLGEYLRIYQPPVFSG